MSKRKAEDDLGGVEKKAKTEELSPMSYPHEEGVVCHVEVPATDLKVSENFYLETFGWSVLESFPGDRVIFRPSNGAAICLSIFKPKEGEGEAGAGPGTLFYTFTKDIYAALEKIHNNGGIVIKNAKANGGDAKNGCMATVQDPDGNEFKVIQHSAGKPDVETKVLVDTVEFKTVKAATIYELFTDSKAHQKFTSAETDVCSVEPRGLSKLHGPAMTARNLEVPVKNKRIVRMLRSWDWPQGHYAKWTMEFTTKGKGCKVVSTLDGIPADPVLYERTALGMYAAYWNKLGEGDKKDTSNWKPC